MKQTLIVIDMQNDFISMALGTKEAQAIVPGVKARVEAYRAAGARVIYTRDTHGEDYLQTPEGKKLPVPHCVKGTEGWEIAPGIYAPGGEIIDKPTFGYARWAGMKIESAELVGLCTDICVVSNALILKALYPNADLCVNARLCAGVTPDTHTAALTTMKMCQIDVINE